MDPITNLLIQLGVGGGALAVLKWFAGRVLDLLEQRINATAAAVERIEPKVHDLHERLVPRRTTLSINPCTRPDHTPDPGDAA